MPWIREVKAGADPARVVNISTGGVLLETTARLKPGRRSTLIIVGDLDERLRADADVIRTELVSIGSSGELVYRTALAFTEAFDLRVVTQPTSAPTPEASAPTPGPVPPTPSPVVVAPPEVAGPLRALWHGGGGTQAVEVLSLGLSGCRVRGEQLPQLHAGLTLTVLFSPVRSLLVSGVVREVVQDGVLLTFAGMTPESARLLRVEIREAMAVAAAGGGGLTLASPASTTMDQVEWRQQVATLHANQW